ncbi:uncharacterized protein LOC121386590 [Gigantopelta aegis]|uniref:uncharacterized protein LOC121386590 n=1 Tax=Gigantopelta aegis TaxID=1735272 RepID=UPI001B88CBFB|nr:uncharacterized protein LOC121386590 [Gigantopelta aegis]
MSGIRKALVHAGMTGAVPGTTGSVPWTTGAVPGTTGAVPGTTGAVPPEASSKNDTNRTIKGHTRTLKSVSHVAIFARSLIGKRIDDIEKERPKSKGEDSPTKYHVSVKTDGCASKANLYVKFVGTKEVSKEYPMTQVGGDDRIYEFEVPTIGGLESLIVGNQTEQPIEVKSLEMVVVLSLKTTEVLQTLKALLAKDRLQRSHIVASEDGHVLRVAIEERFVFTIDDDLPIKTTGVKLTCAERGYRLLPDGCITSSTNFEFGAVKKDDILGGKPVMDSVGDLGRPIPTRGNPHPQPVGGIAGKCVNEDQAVALSIKAASAVTRQTYVNMKLKRNDRIHTLSWFSVATSILWVDLCVIHPRAQLYIGAREVGDPNPSWNTLKMYGTSEMEDELKTPDTVGGVETRSQKRVKCTEPLNMIKVKVGVVTANEIRAEQKEYVSLKKVFQLPTLGKEKVTDTGVINPFPYEQTELPDYHGESSSFVSAFLDSVVGGDTVDELSEPNYGLTQVSKT